MTCVHIDDVVGNTTMSCDMSCVHNNNVVGNKTISCIHDHVVGVKTMFVRTYVRTYMLTIEYNT